MTVRALQNGWLAKTGRRRDPWRAETSIRRGFEGGRARSCQWIEGDPSPDDSCKCLGDVVQGWPYCEPHLNRAYRWGEGQGADAKPGAAG